jgi:hypothetical protein
MPQGACRVKIQTQTNQFGQTGRQGPAHPAIQHLFDLFCGSPNFNIPYRYAIKE